MTLITAALGILETEKADPMEELIGAAQDELPRLGYRRVTHELGRRGHVINHKRVASVMRAKGRETQKPGRSGGYKALSLYCQSVVQHGGTDNRYAMCALRRPPHSVFLGHASIGDFVHAALCARG